MHQNQSKQVMKVTLPYYGNNKCEPTQLFLTINRTTIIRETTKGTWVLIDAAIPGDRNVIKKRTENILKHTDLLTNSAHVECENKSNTGNKTGDWNHFRITHTISEQNTTKARNLRKYKKQSHWALHRYHGKNVLM